MLAGADAILWQPNALFFSSWLARVGVGSVTCGKDWQGTLQTEPGADVRAANRSPNAVATSCTYGTKYCRFAHMLPVCCQGYQHMGKMQRPSLCTHTAVYYISQCSRILHTVLELSVMALLAVSLSRLPFSGQAWNADICGRVVSCRAGLSMETHHALAPGSFLAAEFSRASQAPGCRRMRVIQLAIFYLGCILCWLEKLVQSCRSICIMLARCMLACAIKHRRRMNPFRFCLQAHQLTSKMCIAALG